jgi:hypothetical protein
MSSKQKQNDRRSAVGNRKDPGVFQALVGKDAGRDGGEDKDEVGPGAGNARVDQSDGRAALLGRGCPKHAQMVN